MSFGDWVTMKNPALSIDFGRTFLKIIAVSGKGKKFKVNACAVERLPAVEGNNEQLAEFIKNFIAAHCPGCKRLFLTISESAGVFTRHFEIPAVPRNEIVQAAKWQLKDDLPENADSYALGWDLSGEDKGKDGQKRLRLSFVVVDRKLIDGYLQIASLCGLEVERISYAPFNYGRILRSLPLLSEKAVSVLDVGHEDSFVSIYKGGRLAFVRRIPFSSNKLVLSLTTTFVAGSGKVEYSYDKARSISEEFGIIQDENIEIEGDIRGIHVISLMRPLLENLVRDIKSSFSYLRSLSDDGMPEIIYLTGGGANLKNLSEYLKNELNVQVSLLPIALNCSGFVADAKRNQFGSAAGALLPGPDSTDMLPLALKKSLRFQRFAGSLCVGLFLMAVALSVLFLYDSSVVSISRNEFKGYSLRFQEVNGLKAVKHVLDSGQSLIQRLRSVNIPAYSVMKAVSAAIPANIYLEEFSFRSDTSELFLKGAVSSSGPSVETKLAEFVDTLRTMGMAAESSLKYSSSGQDSVVFELTCRLVKKGL